MTALRSLVLLSAFFLLITTLSQPKKIPRQPTINNGSINLSHWQSSNSPSIKLSGEWFWKAENKSAPGNANQSNVKLQTIPVSRYNSDDKKTLPTHYWLTITPPTNRQNLGLFIHYTCSTAQVYFQAASNKNSNQPIATLGKTGAKGSYPYAGSIIPLSFQSAAEHRLLIQTSNQHLGGSLCGEIKFGDIGILHKEATASTLKVSIPTAMLAMAAIYSFALYAQRPKDKTPLWLALACCSTTTFFFMYNGLLELFINSKTDELFELRYRIQLISCGLIPAIMMMFYSCNFSGYLRPSTLRLNGQLTMLTSLLFAITPTAMIWPIIYFFVIYWSLQFAVGLWVLWKAIIDQQPYARAMLLAALPITVAAPLELLGQSSISAPTTLSLYALLFFIVIDSQIVGRKFSLTFQLAERLSNNLREEVALQTAELHEQNHRLEVAQRALTKANIALKELSITDGLTGIYNRMYFEQALHKEWRRSARQKIPLSILMVDADYFKQLNDSAGHKVGDLCLQAISAQLKSHFKRAGELVARYGGEEFVALLPETDQQQALAAAESLRIAIENLAIAHKNKSHKVTISIGVSTTIPTVQTTPDNLLETADAALYKAKTSGRNRVAMATPPANQDHNQRALV